MALAGAGAAVVADGAAVVVVSGAAVTGAAAVVTAASVPAHAEKNSIAAAPASPARAIRAVRSIASRLVTGYGGKSTQGGWNGGDTEHDVLESFPR
jgi:hypothetical protein